MGSLLADGMGALMSIYGAGSGAIRDPEVGKEWPGATNSTHQSDSAIGDCRYACAPAFGRVVLVGDHL